MMKNVTRMKALVKKPITAIIAVIVISVLMGNAAEALTGQVPLRGQQGAGATGGTTTQSGSGPKMYTPATGAPAIPEADVKLYFEIVNEDVKDWLKGANYNPQTGIWTTENRKSSVRYSSNGRVSVSTKENKIWGWNGKKDEIFGDLAQGETVQDIQSISERNGVPIIGFKDGLTQVGQAQPIPTDVYDRWATQIDLDAAKTANGVEIIIKGTDGKTGTITTTTTPIDGTTRKIVHTTITPPDSTTKQEIYTATLPNGGTARLENGVLTVNHFEDTATLAGVTFDLPGGRSESYPGFNPPIDAAFLAVSQDKLRSYNFETGAFVEANREAERAGLEATAKTLATTSPANVGSVSATGKGRIIAQTPEGQIDVKVGDGKISSYEIDYPNGDFGEWNAKDKNFYRYGSGAGRLAYGIIDDKIYFTRADGGYDTIAKNDVDTRLGLPKAQTINLGGVDKSIGSLTDAEIAQLRAEGKIPKYQEKQKADKTEAEMEGGNANQKALEGEDTWNRFWTGRGVEGEFDFSDIGRILSWYRPMHGLSNALFGEGRMDEWREKVDEQFAKLYLGVDYWASEICRAEYDMEGDSVAYVESNHGLFQFIGTVQADRSDAVPLLCNPDTSCKRGTCRTRDHVCIDNEGKVINEFFYKISYGVVAPTDQGLTPYYDEQGAISFNIVLSGPDKTASIFTDFVNLKNGESAAQAVPKEARSPVLHYSPFTYTNVCLIFGKRPVDRKGERVGQVCNPIVVAGGSFANFKGAPDQAHVSEGPRINDDW